MFIIKFVFSGMTQYRLFIYLFDLDPKEAEISHLVFLVGKKS